MPPDLKQIEVTLDPPSLHEAAKGQRLLGSPSRLIGVGARALSAIESGAGREWSKLSAAVTDCPPLDAAPFHLAAPGLGGSAAVLDVGGPGHLFPTIRKDKLYDLANLCHLAGLPTGFALGPGAAPHHKIGHNAEVDSFWTLGRKGVDDGYRACTTATWGRGGT